MLISEYLVFIPVLTILLYIPDSCYLDWKYRAIEHDFWKWLFIINFPVMLWLYYDGTYPIECLWISLVAVGIWFLLTKMNWIGGADFMFLAAISLFFVVNPVSQHVLMPLVVAEYLVASCAVCWMVLKLLPDNTYRDLVAKFPMIITISLAFLMALFMG